MPLHAICLNFFESTSSFPEAEGPKRGGRKSPESCRGQFRQVWRSPLQDLLLTALSEFSLNTGNFFSSFEKLQISQGVIVFLGRWSFQISFDVGGKSSRALDLNAVRV